MRVVLVHQGDVVIDIFLLGEHAAQAVRNDDGEFVSVGWIVAAAVRDERGCDLTAAVLVLQAFSVERRSPGRRAEQETARATIAGRPGEIADALKTEHRVEDVERNHRKFVIRIRGSGRNPRRDRAGLVDAFLQDLPELVFAIPHELLGVLRVVELADRRVDPELAEHAFHAEGTRFVGDDRHDARSDLAIARDRIEDANEGHRRGDVPIARALQLRFERVQLGNRQRSRLSAALRNVPECGQRVRAGSAFPAPSSAGL